MIMSDHEYSQLTWDLAIVLDGEGIDLDPVVIDRMANRLSGMRDHD